MRLDLWLWRARFFKTRSLAARTVESSGVRIDRDGLVRRVDKASSTLAVGDVISFTRAREIETVEVLSLPARRGPAKEAAETYANWHDDRLRGDQA